VVWTASPEDGEGRYVAVFNLGETAQGVDYSWKELGLGEGGHAVRDLWARRELGSAGSLKTMLPAHAAMLYRVR
jgi:alpha-galactosidase